MSIGFWLYEKQCNTVQSVSLSEQFGGTQRVLDTATEVLQHKQT